MNTAFKNVVIFGLGAATGAFVAIKLLEDHYAAQAQEEIEEVKEIGRKKIQEVIDKYNAEVGETFVDAKNETAATSNVITPYKHLASAYSKPNLEELAKNIDKAEMEYPREDDDYIEAEEVMDELDEMLEEEADSKTKGKVTHEEPYLITEEEFSNENLHYDKETLWYYEDDKVLADDNEEMIDDYVGLIGEDALGLFDNIEGERTIYIRNERRGSDFEIICLAKSFSRDVLNLDEEGN